MATPAPPSRIKTPPHAPAPATSVTSPRRFTIVFEDDALRARSEETARQLLRDAIATSDTSSNAARLAKKALKYRKVLERMEGVDVTSPAFSASAFLGVDWCKTADLKAYCDSHQ